ncbi:MAG: DUF5615 family PIN-like protein [Acidobacteria bacterium]|nr:DUF5615 family PIN-like protein [Acidobacteriota bacterium]
MIAFLANENISKASVRVLREHGHDVKWIVETSPSIRDEVVLMQASVERRIVITFDSDYGELIFRRKLIAPLGVIYLRINSTDETEPARLILKYLATAEDIFDNKFSVLTESGIRYKHL